MSLLRPVLNTCLRLIEKPRIARTQDPQKLRSTFETQAKYFFHAPRGTQQQWTVLEAGGRRVEALEVVPDAPTSDVVIFYVHGGGFVFGSPRTHAAMVAQLGHRVGARAVLPRYRLAPESPFPAQFDDVRTAWDGLLASGVDPARVFVGGDSAGGALALALLAALVRDDAPQPGGVFCFSPLTDMTHSGQSFMGNARSDAVLPAERADDMGQMCLRGQPADDPRISPFFAQFTGASPVWLTVGDTEILYDDARRMAQRLEAADVDVTLETCRDLPHVWPIFHNILPEARATLDTLAIWIRQQPGWAAGN